MTPVRMRKESHHSRSCAPLRCLHLPASLVRMRKEDHHNRTLLAVQEQGGSVGLNWQEGGQEQRNPNPQAAGDELAWDPAAEAPSTLSEFADAADGAIDDLPLSLEARPELAP